MFIHKLVVSYPDNGLARLAFQQVIAEVWMKGKIEGGQEWGDFVATLRRVIQEEGWIEGTEPTIISFGGRYIFYHYSGDRIQYRGGEISVEFSPTGPNVEQETLAVLQSVSRQPEHLDDEAMRARIRQIVRAEHEGDEEEGGLSRRQVDELSRLLQIPPEAVIYLNWALEAERAKG